MKPRTKRLASAVTLALVLVGYVLLLWRGPWWIDGTHLRHKNLQPADGVVITGFRTMLVALGAGAVAALGLHYTHKNHQQTEKLFEHTREKDREQAELTREGQVTERYVEAIKLLGSSSMTERLGGIYSLERIMGDSEKDHSTVVEVLAAFVRGDEQCSEGDGQQPRSVTPDVQAAVTVLGRRPARSDEVSVDLTGANLFRANLSNARLANARIRDVYLEQANLEGVDLRGADLTDTTFKGAYLGNADMRGADLTTVNFKNATLYNADLRDTEFPACVLVNTDFREARLDGSVVTTSDLSGAIFTDASLDGAAIRLIGDVSLPRELAADPRFQKFMI
ncbi:pentapeptide repeat-containing protein [Streptomyces decoyicus]|uniref:pentapeptide repeat-containing protein n=1 Tax=Streptomyces decoyicus TaxID=249567 RepID=UPI002E19283B|nr:pentapeptide repeat-containing protein [Streptomyces decoyicus]